MAAVNNYMRTGVKATAVRSGCTAATGCLSFAGQEIASTVTVSECSESVGGEVDTVSRCKHRVRSPTITVVRASDGHSEHVWEVYGGCRDTVWKALCLRLRG